MSQRNKMGCNVNFTFIGNILLINLKIAKGDKILER
jgi:hypothetical protein